MAFLQLCSTNPDFSYILKKNPSSGMLIKKNRKGRLFAWYGNPATFNIYFRDSDTEVSYSKEDFEYMDVTRYNAPMFLINAFSEFLNHMKKGDNKDIIGYDNTLLINQMKCKPGNLERFKLYFPDFEFKFDEVTFKNFRIEIKTKKTLMELINMGQFLAIFNSLLNNDFEIISSDDIEKYISCLNVIDSPYFIRHLFKLYFLRTPKIFYKYKVMIEKSERDKIEFEFGNTNEQRIYAIKKHLDFRSSIIDIGCGNGEYVQEFAPKLGELKYHAIDKSPDCIEIVKRLCKRKEIENTLVWSSVDDFISYFTDSSNFPKDPVVLMSEVIEHMNKEDAAELINKILGWEFKSLIITTPNKTFNSNFQFLEEEMRHEDHIFEFTKEEFVSWIEEIIGNIPIPRYNVEFFDIGDCVNNLRLTSAVIISRVNKEKIMSMEHIE